MRVSQYSLAWLLAAGLSLPAGAGAEGKGSTAPGKYTSWGEMDFDEIEIVQAFKFADYTGVAVAPLDVSKVPERTDNEAKNVKEAVATVDQPFLEGLKKGVASYSKKTEVQAGAGSGHALLIKGTVLELDPGSKAARAFAGYGAGATRAKITGEVVEADTGKVLLRFTHEKRAGSGFGFAGGGSKKLMLKSAEHIGEDLGKVFKAF
jgi:Domain of unknown function (DUF4410)